MSKRRRSHHRRDEPGAGGWTVVLSGPEHLEPLQAATTEAESLSTSIRCVSTFFWQGAGRLASAAHRRQFSRRSTKGTGRSTRAER